MSGFAVGVLPPTLKGYDIEPENNEETLSNMMEFAVVSLLLLLLCELLVTSALRSALATRACLCVVSKGSISVWEARMMIWLLVLAFIMYSLPWCAHGCIV
jgi:hypothetical protein